MITAHKKNRVNSIPAKTKLDIALQAIKRTQNVTEISKQYNCSRTTVYQQQERVIHAANNAFQKEADDALFHVPVTKAVIHKMVVALFLVCKSSYRDIMFFLETMFNYSLSIGNVFNIIDEVADNAALINESYDLSKINISAADELFHWNKPLLAAVDIDSRFCALLAKAEHRDYETWAIYLFGMQDQGYAPDTTILDAAKGLTKGHQEALPDTQLQYDHFHIIKDLKDCGRFLKNQVASAVTEALKLLKRADNARNETQKIANTEVFSRALTAVNSLEETHNTFRTLSQWLQHDVLQLAGHQPEDRAVLYDFIVEEMTRLLSKHPHRINEILTSLKNQRNALLDVANTLNERFAQLALKYEQPIETIWAICYVARYDFDSRKYNDKSSALESLVGDQYDAIEDNVLSILDSTHRCSSMIENFNSRLRPYLDERKMMTQKILSLIQFYLNHKPFMRSMHERLENKSPAEAMTGKPHRPWLEMLGFPSFKNKAA
jgi:hypothetical protein